MFDPGVERRELSVVPNCEFTKIVVGDFFVRANRMAAQRGSRRKRIDKTITRSQRGDELRQHQLGVGETRGNRAVGHRNPHKTQLRKRTTEHLRLFIGEPSVRALVQAVDIPKQPDECVDVEEARNVHNNSAFNRAMASADTLRVRAERVDAIMRGNPETGCRSSS